MAEIKEAVCDSPPDADGLCSHCRDFPSRRPAKSSLPAYKHTRLSMVGIAKRSVGMTTPRDVLMQDRDAMINNKVLFRDDLDQLRLRWERFCCAGAGVLRLAKTASRRRPNSVFRMFLDARLLMLLPTAEIRAIPLLKAVRDALSGNARQGGGHACLTSINFASISKCCFAVSRTA